MSKTLRIETVIEDTYDMTFSFDWLTLNMNVPFSNTQTGQHSFFTELVIHVWYTQLELSVELLYNRLSLPFRPRTVLTT